MVKLSVFFHLHIYIILMMGGIHLHSLSLKMTTQSTERSLEKLRLGELYNLMRLIPKATYQLMMKSPPKIYQT